MSAGVDLEVVLHEERDPVVQVRPGIRGAAAPLGADLIEQEVGEREAGECAAVGEQAEQPVVAGVEAAAARSAATGRRT